MQAATDDSAEKQSLKRVLIVQSFGSDFAPYNALSSTFRSDLAASWPGPVEFFEISDLGNLSSDPRVEAALFGYLAALGELQQPDLVVTIGAPAGQFALSNRGRLFPATPVLYAGISPRMIPEGRLTRDDAVVPLGVDLPRLVENTLQVLPRTETVAVIIGTSPIERYWRGELGRELRPFEDRVRLVWWDDLPGKEILARAAALPKHSAILYTLFLVDAAGVPHTDQSFLRTLHEVSSAPIFGLFDAQLGEGIVGGPLLPISRLSALSAKAAASILRGEPPADSRFPPVTPEPTVFDGRELRRWGISERDLPPGSIVRFRPPPLWVQYRWPVLGGLSIIALLTGLVASLLIQRARRHGAENEVRALSRRLLTASEDERRWLARELHDDLAQRLARLAIDAARLERADTVASSGVDLAAMRAEVASMSSDVHALSRRLHPSILDNLGLGEALRADADRFAKSESIAVNLQLEELETRPPPDAALCLYRIAQEALNNVARHAHADRVEVSLRTSNGGCELEIRDNGIGFDPEARRSGPSLGHASMRERVRSVGGRLAIRSVPHHGTTVAAWVPLRGGEP